MATKSDIAQRALARLAITGFSFEVDPEEIREAVIALEYQMADWDARGIKCGYRFAVSPETANVADESGLPDIAFKAVTDQLAITLSDSYGKQPSQMLVAGASASMTSLLNAIQFIPVVQYPNRMPLGSGNMRRGAAQYQRYYRQADTLDADNAGPINTNGNGVLQP